MAAEAFTDRRTVGVDTHREEEAAHSLFRAAEAGRTSREASLHAAASVCCTAGRRNHCKETEADRRRDITDLTHLSR